MLKRLHLAIWLILLATFSCEDTEIQNNIKVCYILKMKDKQVVFIMRIICSEMYLFGVNN